MNDKTKKHIDVYSIVTNRIIEHLEKGVVPWRQPWTEAGMPQNLVSGKQYRGINLMLLASLHYSKNIFLTFKQARELGGSIKKGEKSCPVIFWKQLEKENKETKEIKRIPFLQYYNVFNIDQCEGIPKEKFPQIEERKNDPIQSCEEIIARMPSKPEIRHKEHRAYYSPKEDYVNMPEMKTFMDSSSYYGTLFHELVHSSGHTSRLNRKEVMEMKGFGSESYSIEELTAEIGASYLKSCAGIPIENLENSTAYIKHWLERLKNDRKFIVHASAQAQKATDFILNIREVEKELVLDESSTEKKEQRGEQLQHLRGKALEKNIQRFR